MPQPRPTPPAPKEALIKSRDRVRDLAEVYTARREVDAMLDLVKTEAASIDSTFLEPACGNGNFLVAILERKLATVRREHGKNLKQLGYTTETQERFEFLTLRALASIYGIDIDLENVTESRTRMRNMVKEHAFACLNSPDAIPDPHSIPGTPGFRSAIDSILDANIVLGDSLEGADRIVIVDYEADRRARAFRRTFHTLQGLIDKNRDENAAEQALFDLAPEPKRTGWEHYSAIATRSGVAA